MNTVIFFFASTLLEIPIKSIALFSEIIKKGYRYEVERRLRGKVYSLIFRCPSIKLGGGIRFEGINNIHLNKNTIIFDDVDLIATGEGTITIGENSHIGRKSIVNGLGGVEIGSNTSISTHVSIFSITQTSATATRLKKKVTIGNNVLVGSGATILPGVDIADNAKIGAGAVVTKNVNNGDTVVGIPAKSIN